ncbi:alpha/beta hydrolase [Microbacterium trichothecenolyticum]|uniref:Pimeloyl-ACP methyl ester carboxylesterase n=1 Tax=Microbacterium trichothecenolyticum TaxID=69370 RepID=A0ABU0TZ32_MICTR|nr:alpha/beta hydrolase [Microbacterium trichothecenolyticum]MDQ1124904.1 pimeloyl-ACP methyl ester carboxylesterase [Microbacterium trichothecenolyticum]
MSARRRLTAVVAGAIGVALALSGCLYAQIPPLAPDDGPSLAPQTEGIDASLLPYYGQTLTWEPCGAGFDCTSVTAPRDYADPSAGDLRLAVIRHRATSGAPLGSLLTNPGGPGVSGVDTVRDSLSLVADDKLTSSYDIIGFDPRGVGQSSPVTCFDAAGMDAYLYDIPPGERGSEERTAALEKRQADFAKACQDNSDGILPYVSTENAARDMDVLRAVLGDPKLNYLGFSYGSLLGTTYADLFPERVGRMVLDGGIDPSLPAEASGVAQAVGFENALRAFMADCLTTSECAFSGSVDDAMADLSSMLKRADARPLTAGDGRRLGADSLMTAIIAALYSDQSWPYLRTALAGVQNGDPTVAFQLADFYNGRVDGAYTDNTMEALRAYNCIDYPAQGDDDSLLAQLEQQAPIVAPYWVGPDPCDVWSAPATGAPHVITAPGSPPIVVLGTTGDPATPYTEAQSLAEQLSQGVLVTYVGEGHLAYNKGNVCVNDAVDDYLIDGTVPTDGLRCE